MNAVPGGFPIKGYATGPGSTPTVTAPTSGTFGSDLGELYTGDNGSGGADVQPAPSLDLLGLVAASGGSADSIAFSAARDAQVDSEAAIIVPAAVSPADAGAAPAGDASADVTEGVLADLNVEIQEALDLF
ncbi:hypothetical protein [Thalassococcus lentus]|uniref:Uncharacterized protein n=1 Tax=Thalassococcus lentus TaxID=1210524 RepID=A0ABT4XXG1_9RHOB|nr:hypothetical protein [Thalassococcus lentus]MDA7426655.1 hypothetical protein [Thalassococcus lentus]